MGDWDSVIGERHPEDLEGFDDRRLTSGEILVLDIDTLRLIGEHFDTGEECFTGGCFVEGEFWRDGDSRFCSDWICLLTGPFIREHLGLVACKGCDLVVVIEVFGGSDGVEFGTWGLTYVSLEVSDCCC